MLLSLHGKNYYPELELTKTIPKIYPLNLTRTIDMGSGERSNNMDINKTSVMLIEDCENMESTVCGPPEAFYCDIR